MDNVKIYSIALRHKLKQKEKLFISSLLDALDIIVI